jgi:hypothetical protein
VRDFLPLWLVMESLGSVFVVAIRFPDIPNNE